MISSVTELSGTKITTIAPNRDFIKWTSLYDQTPIVAVNYRDCYT